MCGKCFRSGFGGSKSVFLGGNDMRVYVLGANEIRHGSCERSCSVKFHCFTSALRQHLACSIQSRPSGPLSVGPSTQEPLVQICLQKDSGKY